MNDNSQAKPTPEIEGQLNAEERAFITRCIVSAPLKPRIALEVGTWLGGGSTLHILQAMEQNGTGRLYGIEADLSIYERMVGNIRRAAPEASKRFTPIQGVSDEAIPRLLAEQPPEFQVDFAFLDGGNNPMEQIAEFKLLEQHIPVGGQLLAHDARMRKGKFLVPYLRLLDNWETQLFDFSHLGLVHARKLQPSPTPASLRAAENKLRWSRLEPKEVAATILPRRLCAFVLKLLPRRLAWSLSDGA